MSSVVQLRARLRRVLVARARRFLWEDFATTYRDGYDDGRCAIAGLVDAAVRSGHTVENGTVRIGVEEWTALVLAATPPAESLRERAA